MTTIAIIGSRAFPPSARVLVQDFVAALPADTRLVSGGAVGQRLIWDERPCLAWYWNGEDGALTEGLRWF